MGKKLQYELTDYEYAMRDFCRAVHDKAIYDYHYGYSRNSYEDKRRISILEDDMNRLGISSDTVEGLRRCAEYISEDDGGASVDYYDKKINETINHELERFTMLSVFLTLKKDKPLSSLEYDLIHDGYNIENNDFHAEVFDSILKLKKHGYVCKAENFTTIINDVMLNNYKNTTIHDISPELETDIRQLEYYTILTSKNTPYMNYTNLFKNNIKRVMKKYHQQLANIDAKAKTNGSNFNIELSKYFAGCDCAYNITTTNDSYRSIPTFEIDQLIIRDLLKAKVSPERIAEEVSECSPRLFTKIPANKRLDAAREMVSDLKNILYPSKNMQK